jgi:predicted nicotinamide N-methyase
MISSVEKRLFANHFHFPKFPQSPSIKRHAHASTLQNILHSTSRQSFVAMTAEDPCLYFQDVVSARDEHSDDELSLAFFELANAKLVGFRLDAKQMRKKRKSAVIVVKQDAGACGQHTGGIVWETCYLLMNFLLSRREKLGNVLEVGAGCSMLGLVLQASGFAKRVVLTEAPNVMENLLGNVKRNQHVSKKAVGCQLDWNYYKRDAQTADSLLRPHSFDTIVGTDVIFAPSLVEPLLQTLQYMSHEQTVVYLSLQVRCPDSHRLFLETASQYGWELKNISSELSSIAECAWGLQMECHLLQMTRISKETKNNTSDGVFMKRKRKSRHDDNYIEDKKKREKP